jgi:hypothetical protein
MAKAKSKNPIGRPRFEVTPEVLQSAKSYGARINQRTMRCATWYFSSQFFQIYQAENSDFSDAIKKGEASGIGEVTNALFENATVKRDNVAIIFYLKNRAGWVDKTETKIHEEKTITLDLTRIGTHELQAIERAFKQSYAGASHGREIPQIIEGVYESSMADD